MTSKEITESLDRICVESGIKNLQIIATGYFKREDYEKPFIACASGETSQTGDTAEEAITKFRAGHKTPAQKAAEKREAAQKLVLEAEILEREGGQ